MSKRKRRKERGLIINVRALLTELSVLSSILENKSEKAKEEAEENDLNVEEKKYDEGLRDAYAIAAGEITNIVDRYDDAIEDRRHARMLAQEGADALKQLFSDDKETE